jgi:hypothetical protein
LQVGSRFCSYTGAWIRLGSSLLELKNQTQEPLAKLPSGYRLCQGTTLVVPQAANLDSGFSRCGIANYCKQNRRG